MTALFFDDIIAFKEMMYEQRSAETEKDMKRRKREGRYCRACHNQTLRAAGGGWAGRSTLEGHQRGVFSGGEIQRLRRLRQEAHTPTVLVAVSD